MARSAWRTGLIAGGCLTSLAGAMPVRADTLRDALVMAYQTNPTLQSARAQQRGVDENVPIARAPGLPSASATATYSEFVKRSPNSYTSPERALAATGTLGQPIYSGGAVKNAVKAAKIRVEAGQADLRGSESTLFSNVVSAYMDVIRGEAVVALNRQNVHVLEVNLNATSDRFQIGDLTRTDVAQSQSRLAQAQGEVRNAEATLAAARETYIQLVGKAPQALETPPPLPGLPTSAQEAVRIALDDNPDLIAARERTKAAVKDIDVAGAGRLPTVSLYAQGGYNDYFGTLGGALPSLYSQTETSAQAGVQVSLPIFQGGLPAAKRRQAQATAQSTQDTEIAAEREVIAQVRSAYSSWQAARDVITTSQVAVDAAKLSLEGVRAENSVGNRTILDILNAEQELLNAQVSLVTARRDAYVAGFTLLAAMGHAEARDLNLDGGTLYNPELNYERVRHKVFDWGTDPDRAPKATRTIDTQAQDGNISADKAREYNMGTPEGPPDQ